MIAIFIQHNVVFRALVTSSREERMGVRLDSCHKYKNILVGYLSLGVLLILTYLSFWQGLFVCTVRPIKQSTSPKFDYFPGSTFSTASYIYYSCCHFQFNSHLVCSSRWQCNVSSYAFRRTRLDNLCSHFPLSFAPRVSFLLLPLSTTHQVELELFVFTAT